MDRIFHSLRPPEFTLIPRWLLMVQTTSAKAHWAAPGNTGAGGFRSGLRIAVRSTFFRTSIRFCWMLNRFPNISVALPEGQHRRAVEHLVREDRQEDVCFGLWNASFGQNRLTALLTELIFPRNHERVVRGNVSFE